MQLITHSRVQSFKRCRRRHWFEYELGMRPVEDAKALRMGSAYHDALEQLHLGNGLEAAVNAAWAHYENTPADSPGFDDVSYGWCIEYETLSRLIAGYEWYWQDSVLEFLSVEQSFRIPLINPSSDRASRRFKLAGKTDGIVKWDHDSNAVCENKLISQEIDSGSALWPVLRIDPQISIYLYAARQLGASVDTILYNVTRKPTIRPEKVPYIDDDGLRIVLDINHERVLTKQGKPRQTGDTKLNYTLQSRMMTTTEWGKKLTADIVARPEFYFARREIPRTDDEIEAVQQELWEISQTLGDAQKNSRWYRTVAYDTCRYCPFFGPCTEGFDPSSGLVPEGFEYVENRHSELGDPDAETTTPTAGTTEAGEPAQVEAGANSPDA